MQYFGFDRPSFAFKAFGFGSSEFSPLDLFAGGKQGVWYDPSDKSTLFQDVAATVPVTKDGDPVGLILDKSQGLDLGVDVLLGESIKGFNVNGAGVALSPEGIGSFDSNSSTGDYVLLSGKITAKKVYEGSINVTSISEGAIWVRSASGGYSSQVINQVGLHKFIFSSSNTTVAIQPAVSGTVAEFKDLKIKEIKGNHASQPLAASRPTYRTDGILHWLEFDGVDDYLNVSNGAVINNTISVAFEYYDSSQSIAFSEDSTGYYWGYASTGATYLNLKELSLYNLALSNIKPLKFLLGMYSNSDGLQRMFVNSEVRGPGIAWDASASNPLLIGVRAQKDRNLTGAMYSFILSDKKMLESDIEALERHTANKAGVTL